MNITLLAKKGGVGKSTLSILLYEAFRQAGKTVSMHDWDAQGTTSKAMELITGHKPEIDRKADITIYDTPPNLEHTATATAVRSADIALVVTSPSPADVWEAEDAVRFVQSRNPKAAVRVVFDRAGPTRRGERKTGKRPFPARHPQCTRMLPARRRPRLEGPRQ